jgi:DNA-directed RNA polymerase specialized sigma24 family protein
MLTEEFRLDTMPMFAPHCVQPAEGLPMANDESVSHWLQGLKAGDGNNIGQLWDRYFQRLVRLAGSRLPGHARRVVDEEDVALSAFQSFCERARQGQFPEVANRDDLWRVLFAITVRKAIGVVRHQTRQKRGGGRVLGESGLAQGGGTPDGGLARFLSREPTPDDAAELADQLETLFERLNDATLRVIAFQKLQGLSSEEIAASLDVSTRTVDRKLQLIRATWEEASECTPG